METDSEPVGYLIAELERLILHMAGIIDEQAEQIASLQMQVESANAARGARDEN